jgi:hypothetical protein
MVQAGATVGMPLSQIKLFAQQLPPVASFVTMEPKNITVVNQIPPLAFVANYTIFLLIINGQTFSLIDTPPAFSVSGSNITWLSTIWSVNPGDNVIAIYSSGAPPAGGGSGTAYAPIASPVFTGDPQAPTPAPTDNDTSIATTAFVKSALAASGATGVTSIDFTPIGLTPGPGATGPVTVGGTLSVANGGTGRGSNVINGVLIGAGTNQIKASAAAPGAGALLLGAAAAVPTWLPLGSNGQALNIVSGAPAWINSTGTGSNVLSDSPAFTGTPSTPTAAPGTSTTQLASTAFVSAAVVAATSGVASWNTRTGAVTLTNADVIGVLPGSSTTPAMDGTAAAGTGTTWARADHVHPSDTSRYAASNPSGYQTAAQVTASLAPYAPLASPAFTGTPSMPTGATGVTQTAGTSNTSLATTAFVGTAVGTVTGGYLPLAGGTLTGNLTLSAVSGTARAVFGATGAALRWGLNLGNSTAEGGSATGSNLSIVNYNDAGTPIGTCFQITRATGAVAFQGSVTNDNAAAGQVGEVISSAVASPGITLTTSTPVNVTSISLTAGDWDVSGEVWCNVGTGGATALQAGIGSTSATLPPSPGPNSARVSLAAAVTASSFPILPLAKCRLSLAATTTIYLVAWATFPSGTTTAYGVISARRAR